MSVNRNAPAFTLRGYQQHTVDNTRAAHLGKRRPTGTGVVNRALNVLATGMGKTVIGSAMAADAHARLERVVICTHQEELAKQWVHKLHGMAPSASIGRVQGSDFNDWTADIVVAMVPSVGTERQMTRRRIPADRFGLIVADEAHHSAADTWQYALNYWGAFRGVPTVGFTATPTRGDSRALADTWTEVTANFPIEFGVRNGFLVKPRGVRVQVRDLMLDEVKRSRGDFQDNDLGAAMVDADAGGAIAKAYLEHTPGRRAAMFCPNVASAKQFAEDLNEAGIPTEVVIGTTTSAERAAIFERFRLGKTLVISGVAVLTEGWDAPWCEVVIMARPVSEKSGGLYIQCVGRGLRPSPLTGKTDCVVLDVAGASTKHKLFSLVDLAAQSTGDPRESIMRDPYGDEVETEAGQFPVEVNRYDGGEIVATEVSLFDDSESSWLQTDRGVWFIPTAQSYWFLFSQSDGGFSLASTPVNGGGKAKRVEKDVSLEAGMVWAERYAADEDPSISSRKSAWRKKKPSEKLAAFAHNLGLPTEGVRQGELSDAITTVLASNVLRKYASRV